MTTPTPPASTKANSSAASSRNTSSLLEMAYRVQLEMEERFAGFTTGGYGMEARSC
jgi:hypothetical protein